jgi:hypothetical protein
MKGKLILVNLFRHAIIIGSYFILGIGIYYSGAKFNVPWFGANDYAQYSEMVAKPFQNNIGAPWGYRVFTPTIAYFIEKTGLYYEPQQSPYKEYYKEYNRIQHDKSLYPLIFTNYIFIVLTLYVILITVEKFYRGNFEKILLYGIIGLFFLSFSTILHGVSGLTEGASLFFISLLNYLFLNDKKIYFALLTILSIFQRELIPVIFFIYILFYDKKNKLPFLIFCTISFTLYLSLRNIYPLIGFENQLDALESLKILINYKFSIDFFKVIIASLNLPIFIFTILVLIGVRDFRNFLPLVISYGLLIPFCISMGIGNNTGRILNLLIPLFFVLFLRHLPKIKVSE